MTASYDVIVVGAGPGGSTAAAFASASGLRTLLVDKYSFPRDKICGDAISGKSMGVMRRLGLEHAIDTLPYAAIRGVTFSGPGGAEVGIPFGGASSRLPGFVCRRENFDHILVQCAVDRGAEVRQKAEVRGLIKDGGAVKGVYLMLNGRLATVHSPIVIGADGAYSTVARDIGMSRLQARHYVAGLRSYYEGMNGHARPGFIELHFVSEILPGYFWIFALPDGAANVGIGMLSATIKKKGVRLKKALQRVVSDPRFATRFEGATRRGPVVGWGLPLGSRPRKMAGDGWMLVGDAASLIDPFTGEGIGNAMLSGMMSAEWAAAAHAKGDFSATHLRAYEQRVLEELKGELRLSHTLQQMLRWRPLVDTIIRRAARSDELASTISCMFDDLDVRRKLLSPLFYLRVLTA